MSDQVQYSVKKRFFVYVVFLSILVLGLLIRYGFLMLKSRESGPQAQGAEATVARGHILDRNGRILALATRFGHISLWRPEMEDAAVLSEELAPFLELPAVEIETRITGSDSDFLYLKRQADDYLLRRIEEALAEGKLKGVSIEPSVGRVYPERNLASQIIGFTGDEGRGLEGIEFAFDHELSPVLGANASGTGARRNGNNVFLTLDINVQYILENISGQVLRDTRAEAVMCIAMDPRTGDILGSASVPGFDPNNFRNTDRYLWMNRPAIWPYEPGSVFKVFSLAALMDSGSVNDKTFFVCNGHYERTTNRGEKITINCLGTHGRVSPREIIIYSCNAGAAYAADQMGAAAYNNALKEFGFGSRTHSGSPGETAGFLRPVERWSERSKPTISIGQEISVSALQMLQAASAVANDGVMVPPRFVLKINSPDGRVSREYSPGQSRRVLKTETARSMRNYMMDVTSGAGTGWRAYIADISMAVKTGTAQLADSRTGSYSATDFIASSLALLPAESPSLALYMVIIKPRGEIWGGRIAAPVVKEAAEALINYLGIPRGRNPQVVHSGEISIPAIPYPVLNNTVPDFTGFSKRQLVPLVERDDLQFIISGEGWVKRQSPRPGTPLTSDTIIILELE